MTHLSRRSRPSHPHTGFTLVELIISLTLLAMILGSVGMIAVRGMSLFRESSARNEINARAGRTIDRVKRELLAARGSDAVALLTTPPGATTVWSTGLDFPTALDWQAGAVVWSSTRRITFELAPGELDNGADDNGNGLIDEGSVVLIDNPGLASQVRAVLVSGVRRFLEGEVRGGGDENGNGLVDEPGFCFSMEDGSLHMRLTLEKNRGADGLLARTLEDSLSLRN